MVLDTDSSIEYLDSLKTFTDIYPIPGFNIYPSDFVVKLCRGDLERLSNGMFDKKICEKKLEELKKRDNEVINSLCSKWLQKIDITIDTWVRKYSMTRYQAIVSDSSNQVYIDNLRNMKREIFIPILDTKGYGETMELEGARKASQLLQDKCGYECEVFYNPTGKYYIGIRMQV